MSLAALISFPVLAQTTEQAEFEKLTREDVGPYRPEHSPDLDKVRQFIFEQTNDFRESHDLAAVTRDSNLDQVAQTFAEFMARTDKYGHTANGEQPSERVKSGGYKFCQVAENIAYFFKTIGYQTDKLAEEAVTGWINSPGHRKNMLREYVTEAGFGAAQSEATNVYYAVQVFARPRSATIEFSISNPLEQEITYQLGEKTFTLPSRYKRRHQICLPRQLWLPNQTEMPEKKTPKTGDTFRVTESGSRMTLEKS